MNNLFAVDINWLNKVVLHPKIKLSTIFLQHCSVVTILYQPCWQLVLGVKHKVVQACWYQLGTGCSFLRVYVSTIVLLFVCREHETSAVQTLWFSPPAPAKKTRENLNNLRGGGAKFLWHRSSGSGAQHYMKQSSQCTLKRHSKVEVATKALLSRLHRKF